MENITVSIPARPEFLHVLRSVIGSVAAVVDLPVDAIEDLRIAVNEACAHLLTAAEPSELSVSLAVDNGTVGVVAASDTKLETWPVQSAHHTLAWQVLCALVEDARFEHVDGVPTIRFAKSRRAG